MKCIFEFLWRRKRRLRPLPPGQYTARIADVKEDNEGRLTFVMDDVKKR